MAHEEDATLHLKVTTTVIMHGKGSHAQTKAYIKMETKHRPLTDDDGIKHCFALLKTTSKRVPEGIYEESIGTNGSIVIFISLYFNN